MNIVGIFTFVLVFFMPFSTASADLTTGLVAYYPFNSNANDESGNGNDGMVYGATVIEDKDGNPDSAYYFDGLEDYIEVADSESLHITESITISLWVRCDDAGQTINLNQYLVCKGGGLDNGQDYAFIIGNPDPPYEDDWIAFWLKERGETKTLTQKSPELLLMNLSPSVWDHFVGTWDGETMRIYKNGVHLPDADTAFLGPIQSYEYPLAIGRRATGTRHFKGSLDEIRIYNRALSDLEIQELYNYSPVEVSWGPDTAEASSTYGHETAHKSHIMNLLSVLLIPVGAVILMRIWRIKR